MGQLGCWGCIEVRILFVLLLVLLSHSIVKSQGYGIVEAYQDLSDNTQWYAFSHYQPLLDTSIAVVDWSSYTWMHNKEILSRQWFQYWITEKFGVGLEVEMWYTYNRDYYFDPKWKPFKLYVIPRVGMQYRIW